MSEDLQAIRRVLAGNPEAFRVLVERYERTIFVMLRSLLPQMSECEDVAQETFLAAYVRLDSYDPDRASFATWLLTIARNKALNALRKKRPVLLEELPEKVDPRTPDDELDEKELFRHLDAGLAALPVEQRTVFVLADIEGLAYGDIVEIQGVSLGTVKSRLARARQKLIACLPRNVETT